MLQSDIDWTEVDWPDLYPRLLLATAQRLRRLTWRGERAGSVPGAVDAHDLVHRAIERTIDGSRVWNRKITLFQHLMGVISSSVNHLAVSKENVVTVLATDDLGAVEDLAESPEAAAMRSSEVRNFLIYLGKRSPTLRSLAEVIFYCGDPTEDLISKLDLTAREFESLQRALRRASERYVQGQQETIDGRS